jgi:hypothetical protein
MNVKNLIFKKTKTDIIEHKKNYVLLGSDGNKITLIIKKCLLPFGYETFNNKYILNIEITPKKDNEHHNIFAQIDTFEKEFIEQINIKNKEICEDIEGKGYYPNMRKSKCGYIIRSYIFGNPEIYTMIGNFKNKLTSIDIKNTVSNIELELGTFWITDNNYGIIWYVKKIEVLYNIPTKNIK